MSFEKKPTNRNSQIYSSVKVSKVIVSHLGEITRDTRTVGDTIRYKIYVQNRSRKLITNIIIRDPLDKFLSVIDVLNNGLYNPRTRAITWKISKLKPSAKTSVEFIAEISATREIRNQAYIEMSILRGKVIKSNYVISQIFKSPKLGWIPFHKESQPGQTSSSNMKDETTMGLTINFDISGMFVQEVKIDGVKYHRTSIPGHANLMNIGEPEIPIVGQIVEIPFNVNLTPKIVKSKSMVLEGYNIYPAQKPVDRSGKTNKKKFQIDKKTYLNNASYPIELTTIKPQDMGIIRGHKIVLIKVNPVQINPYNRRMRVFSNIEIRLEYDRSGQITRVNPRIESKAFEEMLKGVILNYKDQNRFFSEDRSDDRQEKTPGCHYLILTHADFHQSTDPNNPLNRLRNWKQKKGLTTRIVDVATIPGGNNANSIVAYLQNAYDNWYPVPTYVLLVGDADFIPTNNGINHSSHNNTPIGTDLLYTTLDGTDYFPDIFLGRLSVETMQQATDVVNKILNYEQDPPATPANDDFYTNTSLVCLFEDDNNPANINGTEDASFRIIENSESIRNYLLGEGYAVERIYDQSGNWPPGPERYENGTDLPDELTIAGTPPAVPGFPWTGATGDIQAAINGGNFLVTYNGHGDRRLWSRPRFDAADITGLNNGNLTPVIFSLTCMSGWFDNETDNNIAYPPDTPPALTTGTNNECLCELLLREPGDGAVATVGSTRNSFENNDFIMLGVYKALWPDFAPNPLVTGTVPQMQMGPLFRMGQIHNFSKIYMANRYAHDFYREATFEMYHLFGDPEMPVWTDVPLNLDVDHPPGIGSVGEQDFIVKVKDKSSGSPVQSAEVVLTQNQTVAGESIDIIIGVDQTNPDGIARFNLNSVPAGKLDITVTAHNFRPYSEEIKVSSIGATLNRLDPEDGIENQTINVGGTGFGNEDVDVYFDGQLVLTLPVVTDFGQIGTPDVTINVPTPSNLGPANVMIHGQSTDRYAVDVFQVRSKNPIDLFTYSQFDDTTWHLTPGDDPVWNNPEIQLYDGATAVASNNLTVGTTYTVKLKVHNETNFDADNVKITYKWCDYGIGGPWYDFHTDQRDVPANSVTTSEAPFTPQNTGHLCVQCEIYHIEDIKTSNNKGQENLHVGPTSSPTKVCFLVWNLTEKSTSIFLEVRQLLNPEQEEHEQLWASWIEHPHPQILKPGERAKACLIVDPDIADVKPGTKAEFAVTGFINGKIIGGINVELTKTVKQ